MALHGDTRISPVEWDKLEQLQKIANALERIARALEAHPEIRFALDLAQAMKEKEKPNA